MENWLRSILLILFGSVPGLLMAAEDVPVEYSEVVEETPMLEPVIERREFKESEIDTENFELGIFYGVLSV